MVSGPCGSACSRQCDLAAVRIFLYLPRSLAPNHSMALSTSELDARAAQIRLVLADVDGVLTDGGVYYGSEGEIMKRFNIRDGMGVERLRDMGVEVGIITGERSESVVRRAEKLHIELVHLYCKDKRATLEEIQREHKYRTEEIAYIGDDVNDIEIMKQVGLAACPRDAF